MTPSLVLVRLFMRSYISLVNKTTEKFFADCLTHYSCTKVIFAFSVILIYLNIWRTNMTGKNIVDLSAFLPTKKKMKYLSPFLPVIFSHICQSEVTTHINGDKKKKKMRQKCVRLFKEPVQVILSLQTWWSATDEGWISLTLFCCHLLIACVPRKSVKQFKDFHRNLSFN